MLVKSNHQYSISVFWIVTAGNSVYCYQKYLPSAFSRLDISTLLTFQSAKILFKHFSTKSLDLKKYSRTLYCRLQTIESELELTQREGEKSTRIRDCSSLIAEFLRFLLLYSIYFCYPTISYDSRKLLKSIARQTNTASNEKSRKTFEFNSQIDDYLREFFGFIDTTSFRPPCSTFW